MRQYALIILAIMLSTAVMAQENDAVATGKHITLPIPESQVTNLFNRGYQTFGGEVSVIRISSWNSPEQQYFAKIGDYVGSYRIDRVAGTGKHCVVYLVKSNETVEIRAHTPPETDKNGAEQSVPGYPPQSVGSPEP